MCRSAGGDAYSQYGSQGASVGSQQTYGSEFSAPKAADSLHPNKQPAGFETSGYRQNYAGLTAQVRFVPTDICSGMASEAAVLAQAAVLLLAHENPLTQPLKPRACRVQLHQLRHPLSLPAAAAAAPPPRSAAAGTGATTGPACPAAAAAAAGGTPDVGGDGGQPAEVHASRTGTRQQPASLGSTAAQQPGRREHLVCGAEYGTHAPGQPCGCSVCLPPPGS